MPGPCSFFSQILSVNPLTVRSLVLSGYSASKMFLFSVWTSVPGSRSREQSSKKSRITNWPAFLFFLISFTISSQETRLVFSWGVGQNPVTRVLFHLVLIGGALTPTSCGSSESCSGSQGPRVSGFLQSDLRPWLFVQRAFPSIAFFSNPNQRLPGHRGCPPATAAVVKNHSPAQIRGPRARLAQPALCLAAGMFVPSVGPAAGESVVGLCLLVMRVVT